jgi:hypothetical protein
MELILFGIKSNGGEVLTRLYTSRKDAQDVITKRGLPAVIKEFRVIVTLKN